ncbi:MAG: two-component system nitrogen regulation response regulator NtrX [Gammaproteobacteria bacterium]|jgi:two-component system nitrogen regulation response regulator NtrX
MAQKERSIVLVVDDDGDIRLALEMLLQYEGFEAWTAKDGEEAFQRIVAERAKGRSPGAVLADLKMPRLDGIGLLERVRELDGAPPVILISGHGDVAVAVEAMQKGAQNFLEKPLDEKRVLVTLRSAMRESQLVTENTGLRKQLANNWSMIGESAVMQKLAQQVSQVANSDASVLITGENGSGKEVIARNLHVQGERATGPFIAVNCAAIPHELIESELFGHEKGSFTGAYEKRTGHFEAAHGGTLFLDEVGDMPLNAQAKVLRALETHEITRVGGRESIAVDIRVVAATNADLTSAVEQKTFRLDLFYRLNVIPLRAPTLRERIEDIPALAEHLLAQGAGRSGRSPKGIDVDALERLKSLEWPGNVRQLRNVLEAASVFATEECIRPTDLEGVLANGPGLAAPVSGRAAGEDPLECATFEEFKNLSEMLFFRKKLDDNAGNVKRTAEQLGMQRSHLYKKIDRYELR